MRKDAFMTQIGDLTSIIAVSDLIIPIYNPE